MNDAAWSPRFDPPPALRARLESMYGEPQRRHHTLAHVEALRRWLAQWQALARQPQVIDAAIWFHDAVCDPQRTDNEALSAELARTELAALGWPAARIDRVAAMVLATQHHRADAADADTWLLLDLDLSVLGQRADVYDAYSRAIRAEYARVDTEAYREGRRRVLDGFLARDAVYRTPALHEAWEAAARANLARERQALLEGSSPSAGPGAGQTG